jgi:hypothetical protein
MTLYDGICPYTSTTTGTAVGVEAAGQGPSRQRPGAGGGPHAPRHQTLEPLTHAGLCRRPTHRRNHPLVRLEALPAPQRVARGAPRGHSRPSTGGAEPPRRPERRLRRRAPGRPLRLLCPHRGCHPPCMQAPCGAGRHNTRLERRSRRCGSGCVWGTPRSDQE